MKREIKKGQIAYMSTRGHNGFFYPGERGTRVLYDVVGTSVSWVGSNRKKPFSIPENAVTTSGSPARKVVIWVDA